MATVITNMPHKVAWINYIHSTGATDRKPLFDFVVGCYDLGIWDNIVCWPLRSTQNVNSGTIIYSLGGLGNYPAERVGNIELLEDGAFSDGTSDRYFIVPTGAALLSRENVSSGAVYKSSGTFSPSSKVVWLYGNQYGLTTNHASGGWFREAVIVGLINQMRDVTAIHSLGTDDAQTTFTMSHNTTNINTSKSYKNGVLVHTVSVPSIFSPPASGTQSYQICRAFNGASIKMAFHYVIGDIYDESLAAPLYNLYKSTIGQGLGL